MKKIYKLVYGWGINDSDYNVNKYERVGRRRICVWRCPYYQDWVNMLQRCHNPHFKKIHPAYESCIVCEEWKYFSNFVRWVDSQPNRDWMNCHLDKDILAAKTYIYSPDTCVYVKSHINLFLVGSERSKGTRLLGAVLYNALGVNKGYCAYCRNPTTGDKQYLGHFKTELEAHKAWQAKKHEYACQLADLQDDPRVAKALRERYAPDKDFTIVE